MFRSALLALILLAALVACNTPRAPVEAVPDASASTLASPNVSSMVGEPFTVTVQLRDADGGALRKEGHQVTFAATSGTLTPASLDAYHTVETVLSDAEGSARAIFTPSGPGTVTVRAFIGPDTSGAVIGTVSVTVAANAVEVDDVTATYSGAPVTVTPSFYPPELAEGATIEYRLDATVLTAPPVAAGTYTVVVTPATGAQFAATATITITPRPVAVADVVWPDKPYDGSTAAVAASASLVASGVLAGDEVELGAPLVGAFASADVGPGGVTGAFTLSGADAANYRVDPQPTGTASITAAVVTASGVRVDDKVYDATTVAVVDGSLAGVVAGDDVSLVAAFASADVGSDVDAVVGLGGADAANYALAPVTASASITAAPLTIAPAPLTLAYGAALPTSVTSFTEGLLGADEIESVGVEVVGASAPFLAGSYDLRAVAAVAAAGTSLGNYAVTYPVAVDALTVSVGTAAVSLVGATVTYDGTTHVLVPTFDPSAAGDGAIVTYRGSDGVALDGPPVAAGSYVVTVTAGPTFAGSASATLTVVPRDLAVTNVIWADRVYDGGTGATASATLAPGGIVAGDDVVLASQLVGSFASARVGTHDVTGSFQLVGADAANYRVAPQPTGSATITRRPVALQDAVLETKTFDGSTAAVVSGSLEAATVGRGVLRADVARLGYAASFVQAGASDDAVEVTAVLTGTAASDYVLSPAPSLSAPIEKATVIVTPSADQGKTYADDDPTFAYATDGLVGSDALSGALARSEGEDVGTYPFELGSLDGGANYDLELADDAPTFAITSRAITLTAMSVSAVYGAAFDATAVLADGSARLRDEDVLVGALERSTLDVGIHDFELGEAAVWRDGIEVSGNYTIDVASYTVTTRPLTIVVDDRIKTYGDAFELGTTAFTVVEPDGDTGLVGDEAVTSVALASDGAASGASVVDGPYAIVASDAAGTNGFVLSNYDVTYQPGDLTVEQRTVTVSGSFTTASKPYDGGTAAGAVDTSGLVLNNVVEGDDVVIEAVAAFADALVADGKPATLTSASALAGDDAGNYALSLDGAPTGTGSIVKATIEFGITIAGTDVGTTVVYDGDRTFQPNVTTSPDPMPAHQPVAYYVEITYGPTGGSVGSFNAAGTYTVTVTADDPRYVGSSTQEIEVLERQITIASAATGRAFGADDPQMAPSLGQGDSFGRNDRFASGGTLGYAAGDQVEPYAVGTYPTTLGSVRIVRGPSDVDVTDQYAITFANDFTITPATVTVTPSADQGKTYGDDDPTFTYTTDGLVGSDALSGALARSEGEDVGTYPFGLGSLDAGGNYDLVLATGAPGFEITVRPVTLTTAAERIVFGDDDLDLAAILADDSTLRFGDALAGDLALSGVTAGEHSFLLDEVTLTRDGVDVSGNYAVSATYVMAPRSVTVTPSADQGKVYGEPDPALTYTAVGLLGDDALTGDLGRVGVEDVGTHAFELGTLANPNYVLTLADPSPTFAITPRAIALEAAQATKDFSTDDPDLSPVLAHGSSLRAGDTLAGTLAHGGVNVGTYDLDIGTARVLRGDAVVSGNYTITLGHFTIDRLAVTFDIANADLVLGDAEARTHVFFSDGSQPINGFQVAITPATATPPTYRFTYRWTHDADHVAFTTPVTVQRIQDLGTYEVTITSTSANHVGESTLTVWVTDAVGVDFDDRDYEGLVGAIVPVRVQLVGADGELRHAGPAPIVVDLTSDAATADFAVAAGFAPSTQATIVAGETSSAVVGVRAVALGDARANLTATLVAATGATLDAGAATVLSTAQLTFAPESLQVGAESLSGTIEVALTGLAGTPVDAPSLVRVDLDAVSGLWFRDVSGDALAGRYVDIAAGQSGAAFRVLPGSDAIGPQAISASHTPGVLGVMAPTQPVLVMVTAQPSIATLTPATIARGSSATITIAGSGFQAQSQAEFGGSGVTVDAVAVASATQLDLTVRVAADASLGARSLTVTNADGGTGVLESAFTVMSNPQVSSVSPASGAQGSSVRVTVSGSGFVNASLEFGPGITIAYVDRSATQVVVDVAIATDAPTGVRTATLRNADDQTAGFDFTVLFGLSVTGTEQLGAGFVGQWVEMLFTGTGLSDATPSSDAWSEVHVHARSSTSLAAYVQIDGTGSTDITMTAASGSVPAGDTQRVVAIDEGTRELRSGMFSGFSVNLASGATIYIDVEGVDTPYVDGDGVLRDDGHPVLTAQDPHFRLFAPGGGGLLFEDADSGVGSNARGAYTVVEAGAYMLELSNKSSELGTLRYTISVQEGLSVYAAQTQQFGSGYHRTPQDSQWVEMRFFGTGLSHATPQSVAWSGVEVVSRTPTSLVAYVRPNFSGPTEITMTDGATSVAAGTFRRTVPLATGGGARTLLAGESMENLGGVFLEAGTTYWFDFEGEDTPYGDRTWPNMEVEMRRDGYDGPIVVGSATGGGVGRNVTFHYTPTTGGTYYIRIRSPGLIPAEIRTVKWTPSR